MTNKRKIVRVYSFGSHRKSSWNQGDIDLDRSVYAYDSLDMIRDGGCHRSNIPVAVAGHSLVVVVANADAVAGGALNCTVVV